MDFTFSKYQGTGNDFIMIDDREKKFPASDTAYIESLCDRRFGIGADGLILLQKHTASDFYMQYFNSDGRESSMCGNGGRCIASFATYIGLVKNHASFFAIDGKHEAEISSDWVQLKMNNVTNVNSRGGGIYVLNTGSPHFVEFIRGELNELQIIPAAHSIRYGDEFRKEGINVNFVTKTGQDSLKIRTYERGVENETWSCGTGVTASALCLALENTYETGNHLVSVEVKGGKLEVRFQYDKLQNAFTDIWLCGPAEFVFEGMISYAK